jgi:hypothetical protein
MPAGLEYPGHPHTIADLKPGDTTANFHHLTHGLVAKYNGQFQGHTAFYFIEFCMANATGCYTN